MQYLKISLTGQAKAAISGLRFNSQAFYQAGDTLCKKFCRPRVVVKYQLKKKCTPTVRHNDSNGIVHFANVVTNTVNILTRFGYQLDLESEGVLSSAITKISLPLKDQWQHHLRDHRLLAANLLVFKDW